LRDAEGDWPGARRELLVLIQQDEGNPAYLAVLIDGLIRHKKKAEAFTWLGKLEKLNLDPSRLEQFRERLLEAEVIG
jgi:hypothetical protein